MGLTVAALRHRDADGDSILECVARKEPRTAFHVVHLLVRGCGVWGGGTPKMFGDSEILAVRLLSHREKPFHHVPNETSEDLYSLTRTSGYCRRLRILVCDIPRSGLLGSVPQPEDPNPCLRTILAPREAHECLPFATRLVAAEDCLLSAPGDLVDTNRNSVLGKRSAVGSSSHSLKRAEKPGRQRRVHGNYKTDEEKQSTESLFCLRLHSVHFPTVALVCRWLAAEGLRHAV